MPTWNAARIPNLTARTALITGVTSGLGLETAKALAQKGATVIGTYRNEEKMAAAKEYLLKACPGAKLHFVYLDLSDLHAVKACADEIVQRHTRLDILINNAGVMAPPFSRTKQGFELQIGTNHLGHFALTGHLLPLLLCTPKSRIVSVSSIAAWIGKIVTDDFNYHHRPYRKWEAYAQSKLANQLFTQTLAHKLKANNANTIATAAHPGVSGTDLWRSSNFWTKHLGMPLLSQPPAKAALPILRAACDPDAANGSYWGPSFLGLRGGPDRAVIPPRARDTKTGEALWQLSEVLTGVPYLFP